MELFYDSLKTLSTDTVDIVYSVYTDVFINQKYDNISFIKYLFAHILEDNEEYIHYCIYYIYKYVKITGMILNMTNIQNMFLVACIVTRKFLSDIIYIYSDTLKMTELNNNQYCLIESDFLNHLNWDLYDKPTGISKKKFDKYIQYIIGKLQ
jgi:hypothetical protein